MSDEEQRVRVVNSISWGGSLSVAIGIWWYVWGVYGFWWGLCYGFFWPVWVGYRLASYLLGGASMTPEDRAHRRWPVPKTVSLILVPGQRLSEYDLARIHEHFAVLYSVIDAMTEARQSAEPVPDVVVTLKRHHERLAAIEEFLARPKGFSEERLNHA